MNTLLKTLVVTGVPAIAITGAVQADNTAPPAATAATTQPATQPATQPVVKPDDTPHVPIQVMRGKRG